MKAVHSCINHNPFRKQKVMAREMDITPRTLSRIIREDLEIDAYKPLDHSSFCGKAWIFPQDSVPAHKAETIQRDGLRTIFRYSSKWKTDQVEDLVAQISIP